MRTVCAYSLWFSAKAAANEVWGDAASWIAEWYRSELPDVTLPLGWERGIEQPFVPDHDHSIECNVTVLDDAGPLRELRWRFPDAQDPSLVWTIEATAFEDDGTWFTLLLKIASVDFELLPARFQLRPPRLIRHLVARGDAHVGVHPIRREPIALDVDHIPELVDVLLEQSRRHPFVLVSPEPYTDDVYAVDPDLLAATLAGLASVYVLTTRWVTFALTDEIGKRYSCYNGAVRIFWPRFDLSADPFAHPLWLPDQIDELGGGEGFARYLLRMIAGAGSFRFVAPEPIRAFQKRVEQSRIAKLRAATTTDYEALFDEYVRCDMQVRELRDQRDALLADNETLRNELAARWVPPADERESPRMTATNAADATADPTTVLEAVEAAQRRISHVVFLGDALESARESPYKQPDRVLSALLAIDDVAKRWAEQLAGGPKLGARRDAFRQRGFEYKEDISQTAEGKWGEEYTYSYEGRRVVFAPHITIGAKSADRCISIHLYWDETRRKAVVAHVGRHKTNTRS